MAIEQKTYRSFAKNNQTGEKTSKMFATRRFEWNLNRVLVLFILTASIVEAPPLHTKFSERERSRDDIITTPADPVQTVLAEGQLVELPCNITAQPQDTVKNILWFKDSIVFLLYSMHDDPWATEDNKKIVITEKEARLQISNISQSDYGVYQCQVEFSNSPTRTNTFNLKLPPQADSTDTSQYEIQHQNHINSLKKNKTSKSPGKTRITVSDSEARRGNDNENYDHQWETKPVSETEQHPSGRWYDFLSTSEAATTIGGIFIGIILCAIVFSVYRCIKFTGKDKRDKTDETGETDEKDKTDERDNTDERVSTDERVNTDERDNIDERDKTGETYELRTVTTKL